MATKLFANVAVKQDAGVLDLNIGGVETIEVSDVDGYSGFYAMPGYEQGCIKEVLIKTATGASVALYLMAEVADKLTFISKPDLDLEAEVGELRGKPLPTTAEIAQKLADHLKTGAPLDEGKLIDPDAPGEDLDLELSDEPANSKRTLH